NSAERPIGRVEKLLPRHVRRRVVEYHRDVDDELLPGRDDGKAAESEHTADVGKRMRNRRAGADKSGRLAHKGHIRARCVEVVRDRDVVQLVRRPLVVDHDARYWIEHDRDRQLVGERDADGGRGLARRILLVDLLDGNEEILTVGFDRCGGAVDEPDGIPLHFIAGDVADEIDVVEYDQRPAEGADEADVGGQWVGRGEVPDRAITVDIDLRGGNWVDKVVYYVAEIGDITIYGLRLCRDGAQQQQSEEEQQDSH